jgi:hypothetical protein
MAKNEEEEAKFNAGIDAEKLVMDLLRKIYEASLYNTGQAQYMKYKLVRSLCIQARGLFTNDETRRKIWEKFDKLKIQEQMVQVYEGKSEKRKVYSEKLDEELDEVIKFVIDNLQDERDFFSPAKTDLSGL